MKNPAVFLDRDGVIIENVDSYVRSWDDVKFIPSSIEALRILSNTPYKIVIITNQSVVGRGIISLADAEEINRKIVDIVSANGGRIDGVYICPHSPQDGCNCRKPLPGLILKSTDDLSIDLSNSVLIGDALSDIQAGQSAGISNTILVQTGRGIDQIAKIEFNDCIMPSLICQDLYQAMKYLKKEVR